MVQRALPKEVIEYGTATFEQTIDWSGENGPITIVEIPAESYHIADDLEPKWDGFVQGGDPIQTGLTVTASANQQWTPNYTGMIEFDREVADGVKELRLEQNSEVFLRANLNATGLYKWNSNPGNYEVELSDKQSVALVRMGPVPIPIILDLRGVLYLARGNLQIDGNLDLTLEGNGNYNETVSYQGEEPDPWENSSSFSSGQVSGALGQGTNIRGSLYLNLTNHLQASVLDHIGFRSNLELSGFVDGNDNDISLVEQTTGDSLLGEVNGGRDLELNGLLISKFIPLKEIEPFTSLNVPKEQQKPIDIENFQCQSGGQGTFTATFDLVSSEEVCVYDLKLTGVSNFTVGVYNQEDPNFDCSTRKSVTKTGCNQGNFCITVEHAQARPPNGQSGFINIITDESDKTHECFSCPSATPSPTPTSKTCDNEEFSLLYDKCSVKEGDYWDFGGYQYTNEDAALDAMSVEIDAYEYFDDNQPSDWDSNIQYGTTGALDKGKHQCRAPINVKEDHRPTHYNVWVSRFLPDQVSAGSIGSCPCCIENGGSPEIVNRFTIINLKNPYTGERVYQPAEPSF